MLQTKIAASFAVFLVVLTGLLILLLDVFVFSEFEELEKRTAIADIHRVNGAISRELAELQTRVEDWAPWDDTYRFAQTNDADFVRRNLTPGALDNLALDLIVFADTKGDVLWSRIVGDESLAELDLADLLLPAEKSANRASDEGSTEIRLLTGNVLYMIAAHPILTSEHQGPSAGTVIFGRKLDFAGIHRIRTSIVIDFDIKLFGPEGADRDLMSRISAAPDQFVLESNAGYQYSYSRLPGLRDTDEAVLEVRAHQQFTSDGSDAIKLVLYAFVAFAVLSFLAAWMRINYLLEDSEPDI